MQLFQNFQKGKLFDCRKALGTSDKLNPDLSFANTQ